MSERDLVAPLWRRGRHVVRRLWYRAIPGPRELPTYFIVGAKRAGTTSLNEYLNAHPDVLRGSVEKGSRYFDVNFDRGPEWFRASLLPRSVVDRKARVTGVRPIVGESSPYYAFHPESVARITHEVPDARLVFLLREPGERAWSHHKYEVARGFESLGFLDALEQEPERLSSPDPSQHAFALRHHSYLHRGLYAQQIERMLCHVPREQLLILDSAWLFTDPRSTMAEVHAFLALPAFDQGRYPVHKMTSRTDMPRDARKYVDEWFADANEHLARLLDRDLTWIKARDDD